jgi:hypothetical protein
VTLIAFEGFDFTGATFAMDWRLYRDAPTALLSLGNAASNAQGISCTVTVEEGVPTSFVQIRVNETTLEGLLLNAGVPGSDVVLQQDLHITGGGIPKTRWIEGKATIRAGATQ